MARTRRQRARLYLHMAAAALPASKIARSLLHNETKISASATYTYSDVPFGAVHPQRYIVVGIVSRSGAAVTISSVTIGGATATVSAFNDSTNTHSAFAVARLPLLTSGDVVITMSGNLVRGAIVVWRALYLPGATPTDTAVASTAAEGDPSVTIDKFNGGAVFAIESYSDNTGGTTGQLYSAASQEVTANAPGATVSVVNADGTATWTGLTEDADAVIATATSPQQSLSVASWRAGTF